MRIIGALLLVLFAQNALACLMTRPEQITWPDKLIARTDRIVLAKVVRADAASDIWNVLYTFKVERTLKGKSSAAFQILGSSLLGEFSMNRFDEHRNPVFWEERGGREFHDTSCRIRPAFAVGQTYLIFMDAPYHNKSFEQILFAGRDDRRRTGGCNMWKTAQWIGNGNGSYRPRLCENPLCAGMISALVDWCSA